LAEHDLFDGWIVRKHREHSVGVPASFGRRLSHASAFGSEVLRFDAHSTVNRQFMTGTD
jgi:hypothetical protein